MILTLKPVFGLCGIKINLWNPQMLREVWILALMVLVNVGLSLYALSLLSVPLFNVLRRLQTVFVIGID